MADVNFPNSPVNGTTYDYNGIRYTYRDLGGGLGYWQATTQGEYGVATAAEINAGLDALKYVTPLELLASDYLNHNDIAPAGDINTGGNQFDYVTPLQLALSKYVQDDWVKANRSEVVAVTPNPLLWGGVTYGNQNTNYTILGSNGDPAAKFAIVRLLFDSSNGGNNDTFYVFKNGDTYSNYVPHQLSITQPNQYSGAIIVPLDSNGLFQVRWTQFGTQNLKVYLEGYIR